MTEEQEQEKGEEEGGFVVEEKGTKGVLSQVQQDNEEKDMDKVLVSSNSSHGQLQEDGLSPHALVALLKACAKKGDLLLGSRLHQDILRSGLLGKDVFIGSALINMYAKCGSLIKAAEVFDGLPVQDVVSWNALIAGYAQHENGDQALEYLERMRYEGFFPDAVTFVCILKSCGSRGAIKKGKELHAEIVIERWLEKDIFIGNALVDMYAKCSLLANAQEVFDKLPVHDVVSWNGLITGHSQHWQGKEALVCVEQMQLEGLSPNVVTYVCILKACGSIGAVDKGREIHAKLITEGLFEKHVVLGSALVDMYAKCGLLAKAQELFCKVPFQNVVLWSALIAGYAHHKHGWEALNCFEQMQLEGFSPDAVTFISTLKGCGSIGAANNGLRMHAIIAIEGVWAKDNHIGNALVDMYVKCGLLAKAQHVFDRLPCRGVTLWNVLMAGYAQLGHDSKVLHLSEVMPYDGFFLNTVTLVCILKACGNIGAANKGEEIHSVIVGEYLFENQIAVDNALIDMYAKCGLLARARTVFGKLSVRNVISWNVLMAGYVQHRHVEEALICFEEMQHEGLTPDPVTFVCVLKAYGSIGAPIRGQDIYNEIAKVGLLENVIIVNALVDMYGKCGLLAKAREVFDNFSARDAVAWNALIAGYAQHGHGEEALGCFELMQVEGLSPDVVTFVCILKACGSIGAVYKGCVIHAKIVMEGSLGTSIFVSTALIDMYAKCGWLAKAQEVFDEIPVRSKDVVAWNALIAGYALLGKAEKMLQLFHRMREQGTKPDLVTFNSVLHACSHVGLLEKGQMYFETMSIVFGLIPSLEHYSCMVDLFARAGQLDKAIALIKMIPFSADCKVWHTLLSACRKRGNVILGRLAYEHAMQVDGKDAAAYVCLSNICLDACRNLDCGRLKPCG